MSTSICSTNPWSGEKETYKKLMLISWVKQRKDKQAQKGSLSIICFGLAF